MIDGTRRLKHLLLVLKQVCAKERLAHDVQGQATHLREKIEGLLRLDVDCLGPGSRTLGHQPAHGRNPLSMKDRLDQATLVQPGVSIVGQQAIAQRQAEHLVGNAPLAVVEVILLDDMAHPIRMEDQYPGTEHRRQRHEISVVFAQSP